MKSNSVNPAMSKAVYVVIKYNPLTSSKPYPRVKDSKSTMKLNVKTRYADKVAKGKKSNQYRKRKRKYYGNQYDCLKENTTASSGKDSQPVVLVDLPRPVQDGHQAKHDGEESHCSSAKKLKLDGLLANFEQTDFNLIINFKILKKVFEFVGFCPDCKSALTLQDDRKARSGFVHKLALRCCKCNWIKRFFTSALVQKDHSEPSTGRTRFDLNVRSVLAFREIGKGHDGMQTLATFMNLFPPALKSNYHAIERSVHLALTKTAVESCQNAGRETKESLSFKDDNGPQDCQVSVDGSWQKRGHISLNGVVMLISRENGKCLDYTIMSKKCKSCQFWKTRTNDPGYAAWYANHA
eukprot:gene2927-3381_t